MLLFCEQLEQLSSLQSIQISLQLKLKIFVIQKKRLLFPVCMGRTYTKMWRFRLVLPTKDDMLTWHVVITSVVYSLPNGEIAGMITIYDFELHVRELQV